VYQPVKTAGKHQKYEQERRNRKQPPKPFWMFDFIVEVLRDKQRERGDEWNSPEPLQRIPEYFSVQARAERLEDGAECPEGLPECDPAKSGSAGHVAPPPG